MKAESAAFDLIDQIADWSPWTAFVDAINVAPRYPGVYLFRNPMTYKLLYVGHAGERAGSGARPPKGIRGRFDIYRSGKGAASGFGEAVLDRALADEAFVSQHLQELREGGPKRTKEWARDSLAWLGPEVSWTVCPDKAAAAVLEKRIELMLRPHGLWNR